MAIKQAMQLIFKNKKYFILFSIIALAIIFAYIFLLNAFHESFVLFGSFELGYIIELTGIIVLGVLFSISSTMYIYITKRMYINKNIKNPGIIGLLIGTISQLLCCTPIIPFILSFFGASTLLLFNLSGKIQGFFANTWIFFILLSIGLMIISIYAISNKIFNACCR